MSVPSSCHESSGVAVGLARCLPQYLSRVKKQVLEQRGCERKRTGSPRPRIGTLSFGAPESCPPPGPPPAFDTLIFFLVFSPATMCFSCSNLFLSSTAQRAKHAEDHKKRCVRSSGLTMLAHRPVPFLPLRSGRLFARIFFQLVISCR